MSDVEKQLRARAIEKRQRDVNAVGEDSTPPIDTYLDWQAATAIRSLTEERDSARRATEDVQADLQNMTASRNGYRDDVAALTARVGELEAALRMVNAIKSTMP